MALTWLTPGFGPALFLVPLALLLAFLSRRERRYAVASLLPWRAVLALPRPRPRRNPIDLETLCAAGIPLLAVLALMGPVLHMPAREPVPLLLVVDTSHSMRVHSPASARTRLQDAFDRIDRLGRAYPARPLRLYASDSSVPLREQTTAAEAIDALAAVPASTQPEHMTAETLRAVLAGSENAPVIWISDRPAPLASPRLHEIIVGKPETNVAILNARLITADTPPLAFATVANYGSAPRNVTMSLTPPGHKESITIPANEISGISIPLPKVSTESFTLSLDTDDALTIDNRVRLPLEPRSAAVDTSRHPRLALALRTAAECRILPRSQADQAAFAVIDTDDEPLPRKAILLVDPDDAVGGLIELGASRDITDMTVSGGRNALPDVCVAGLGTLTVRNVTLPGTARILADGRVGGQRIPLVAMWEWNGRQVAWINAVHRRWTALPGFPVLVAELVDRLLPATGTLPGPTESDTRMPAPATTALPSLEDERSQDRAFPLSRIFALLAGLCAATLAACEWKRLRVARARHERVC